MKEVEFTPAHSRFQSSQSPFSVDLLVKMLNHCMSAPFALDCSKVIGGVSLMGGSELVMPDHFLTGEFLPFGRSNMVLSAHKGVPYESNCGHDSDEIVGRHGLPTMSVDIRVIDLWQVIIASVR